MKNSIFTPLATAALLAMAMTTSSAQNTGDQKGATGWSGGAKDQVNQTTGQKVEVHDDAAAKTQPVIATGVDLKGPPRQLAPSKTPE